MKTVNVSLVGVGGQGIILTADLLAKTADLAGYDVKKSEIHGMSQRGGSAESVARLGAFALNLGLAFQYEDDLLDGDGAFSREETERLARETTDAAIAALDGLPGDASFLRALAQKLVGRQV